MPLALPHLVVRICAPGLIFSIELSLRTTTHPTVLLEQRELLTSPTTQAQDHNPDP